MRKSYSTYLPATDTVKTPKEILAKCVSTDSLPPAQTDLARGAPMDLGVRSRGNSGLGTVYLALTMCLGVGIIISALEKRKLRFGGRRDLFSEPGQSWDLNQGL